MCAVYALVRDDRSKVGVTDTCCTFSSIRVYVYVCVCVVTSVCVKEATEYCILKLYSTVSVHSSFFLWLQHLQLPGCHGTRGAESAAAVHLAHMR